MCEKEKRRKRTATRSPTFPVATTSRGLKKTDVVRDIFGVYFAAYDGSKKSRKCRAIKICILNKKIETLIHLSIAKRLVKIPFSALCLHNEHFSFVMRFSVENIRVLTNSIRPRRNFFVFFFCADAHSYRRSRNSGSEKLKNN